MSSMSDLLDDDTGEIDTIKVAEVSSLRAAHEFGSMSYPPRCLRSATGEVMDRARALRREWRRNHGLDPHDGDPGVVFHSFSPDTNE